jgi:hypothetical protein
MLIMGVTVFNRPSYRFTFQPSFTHRSSSGKRSFEAAHHSKLELALMMIQGAVNCGILPGYVMFDSWYSWPSLINSIRNINENIRVYPNLSTKN